MSRRPVDSLFAQIEDPVDRALQRELYLIESELFHYRHLQDDRPHIDLIELRQEVAAWMNEHANDPTKVKLAKLDEFTARSKPIERRVARWQRLDLIALMDREFELRRQAEAIVNHRQSTAWYERRKRADDSMRAKWRVFILLEEIRLDSIAKTYSKKKQEAA